jgi:tetratricopeptide (TPR) repeat protein
MTLPPAAPVVGESVSAQEHDQIVQSLLVDARAAQARGDFAKAAESYRKTLALEPDIPELWANLGLMDHEAGNHAEAITSFQRAIRLDSSLFVPQLFLGLEYLQSNKAEAALPHLEIAVELNPQDPQAIRSLAEAYATLGNVEKAIDLDWRAMQLNANNGSVWFDLGSSYLQQVENDARLMTSAYGDSPYVKLRKAEVLATEGKLIEAESAYRAAITARQSLPCAFAELGITLLREGETSAAREQFERELKTEEHCQLATLGLAVADVLSNKADDAVDRLIVVAKADPGFIRVSLPLFRSAVLPEHVKSFAAAVRARFDGSASTDLASLIENALSSDDVVTAGRIEEESASSPSPSSLADAQHLASEGQYGSCTQALKADSQSADSGHLKLLAFCSFYTGDYLTTSRAAQKLKGSPETRVQGLYWESKASQNLSVQALGRAGEIDANSPRMHVLLGDVFRQQHHWDEAEAEYRKAIALEPKSHSARLGLVITLFTELKNDEALSLDESLLSENSLDPEANLLAGEILVQRNQFRKAEPYLLKCTHLKTDLLPRYHALLGRVYAETDRIPAAISEYKLGLATDTDGSIHYQLARLYQKTGNKMAAEEAFRQSKGLVDRANSRERTASVQAGGDTNRE